VLDTFGWDRQDALDDEPSWAEERLRI
jgi:hypothetical protein